jgi:predicted ester cyclase
MKPEEILSFMQQWEHEYLKANLDFLYAYISPDFVFHSPPFPDIVGLEANHKYDEGTFAAYSDIGFTTNDLFVHDNIVVWRWIWEGTHTGRSPSLDIPPTGKRIKFAGCDVIYWKEDMIVEQWRYCDYLSAMQQMGIIPVAA